MAYEFSKEHEVATVSRSSSADIQMDVSNFQKLEKLVRDIGPGAVINAIKPPIPTDKMEEQMQLAQKLNVELPGMLARWQQKLGYALVHLSTDWVYEGKEGTTYDETSPVLSLNYYTQTKLDAEKAILSSAPESLILRSEGIFGLDERRTNLYLRLKDASASSRAIPVASDQFSQPICGAELARVARILVEKKSDGLFNVVGHEYLSRLEFARLVCKTFGFKGRLEPYSLADRQMRVPSHLHIDISKVEKVVGKIRSLAAQFEDLREMEGELGY